MSILETKTNQNSQSNLNESSIKLAQNKQKFNLFNISLLAVILFFLWIFNKNYITSLLLGFIFATITYPFFLHIENLIKLFLLKENRSLAAILNICIFCFGIFFVLNIFWTQLKLESTGFVSGISDFIINLPKNQSFLKTFNLSQKEAQNLVYLLNEYLDNWQSQLNSRSDLLKQLFSAENISKTIQFGQTTMAGFFEFIVQFIIFCLAWFYGLTTGKNWEKSIFTLLPLDKKEKRLIEKNLVLGVRNVMYANLMAGLIHAFVCFLVMLVFGIPNKFIITIFAFLIGFLPLTPSEIAYAPVIFLTFRQNSFFGILLIPLAEMIILWVNFVLIPKTISKGEEGNSLLILTSILSGISIFGIMGFIIGPVIMIFVQTLYKILLKRLLETKAKDLDLIS
jgi:predicted PurR-regulated permease PerM